MFDFANSSYTTVIVTVAFSVYFTRVVAAGDRADWWWGIGITASNLLVVLSAPVVGAIADDGGHKKRFLAATCAACVGGTAALALVGPGEVALGLALFVVSNVAFSLGESLVSAFLPEISTPSNVGRISGLGWGLGYLGGLGCLLLVRPLLAGGFTAENRGPLGWAWVTTAGFFALGALPTFLLLGERVAAGPRRSLRGHFVAGFRRVAGTVRSAGRLAELARFLGAFFLYSCGLTAVIAFAAIFAERTLGFEPGELVALFMLLQLSSAAGAVVLGLVQDRVGARQTILLVLLLWVGVCVGAFLCQSKAAFWPVALVAGLGIGSLQSASRAMVSLCSPVGKGGELFGLWGLVGKAAYAVGPLTFGLVSFWLGSQRVAILAVGTFFVAGALVVMRLDEARGRAQALAWTPE